jgi:hypothetical protein
VRLLDAIYVADRHGPNGLIRDWGDGMRQLLAIVTAVLAGLALAACGGDGHDFTVDDLQRLNFARDEIPDMEYQPDSSGLGAFAADQREEAEGDEEGDEGDDEGDEEGGDQSGLKFLARLQELGLEEDYASQFFATSRDAELLFVESISFLFEDADAAEDAVDAVREGALRNLETAEQIDAPELGEQAFGVRGEFGGFLTFAFGWRVGDVIQLATVATGDDDAKPDRAIELADQLEDKAED